MLKSPPKIPSDQMKDSKLGWDKTPPATCESLGVKGNNSND
jgi:hypothetical protein